MSRCKETYSLLRGYNLDKKRRGLPRANYHENGDMVSLSIDRRKGC